MCSPVVVSEVGLPLFLLCLTGILLAVFLLEGVKVLLNAALLVFVGVAGSTNQPVEDILGHWVCHTRSRKPTARELWFKEGEEKEAVRKGERSHDGGR